MSKGKMAPVARVEAFMELIESCEMRGGDRYDPIEINCKPTDVDTVKGWLVENGIVENGEIKCLTFKANYYCTDSPTTATIYTKIGTIRFYKDLYKEQVEYRVVYNTFGDNGREVVKVEFLQDLSELGDIEGIHGTPKINPVLMTIEEPLPHSEVNALLTAHRRRAEIYANEKQIEMLQHANQVSRREFEKHVAVVSKYE